MVKSENIPQWAWERAKEATDDWRGPGPAFLVSQASIARAILHAVQEERQACAAMADNPDAWLDHQGDFEANQVASAIRNRKES